MSQGSNARKYTPTPTPPTSARPEKAADRKPSRADVSKMTEEVAKLVLKNPEKAAKILADWIHSSKKK